MWQNALFFVLDVLFVYLSLRPESLLLLLFRIKLRCLLGIFCENVKGKVDAILLSYH
jgi:hypothetical protein